MASRTRSREQALQILYLIDVSEIPPETALDLFQANFKNEPADLPYARHLVQGVVQRREELDRLIERSSEHWRLTRMPRIDRNILRMAAFELVHCPDIPTPVAIDEAIELGKKYGDVETGSFINGLLDRVTKSMNGGPS